MLKWFNLLLKICSSGLAEHWGTGASQAESTSANWSYAKWGSGVPGSLMRTGPIPAWVSSVQCFPQNSFVFCNLGFPNPGELGSPNPLRPCESGWCSTNLGKKLQQRLSGSSHSVVVLVYLICLLTHLKVRETWGKQYERVAPERAEGGEQTEADTKKGQLFKWPDLTKARGRLCAPRGDSLCAFMNSGKGANLALIIFYLISYLNTELFSWLPSPSRSHLYTLDLFILCKRLSLWFGLK